MTELTMVQSLNLAMKQEMQRDETVILMGEDVAYDGGIFRVSDGLVQEFGEKRVIDTPLAEAGIAGVAIGMAMNGMRPIAEMQFSGFSYEAFHQIEGHASRFRWRTRGGFTVPLVVRMPYGAGVRALEHHSESREAYWAHTPGLKMVIPSGPRNARALLVAAIRDPDPVIFYEPKAVYRAFREEVPDEEEVLPIGKAETVRSGDDLTIIAYGAMLHRARDAADKLADDDGIEADVIDLRTISPLDEQAIVDSVSRTGRAVVVHEAPMSFGPGAEVVARLMNKCFLYLEAPVTRVTGYDIHMPFFAREQLYLPSVERIYQAARDTANF